MKKFLTATLALSLAMCMNMSVFASGNISDFMTIGGVPVNKIDWAGTGIDDVFNQNSTQNNTNKPSCNKPENKPEQNGGNKPVDKPEQNGGNKPENKPEQNGGNKPENKPEQNEGNKPENKPGQNGGNKPENKPEQNQENELGGNVSNIEMEVVELVNIERKKAGLKPLILDNELSNVARLKSEDMKKKGYFSHTSPTYGSPFNMMKSFGIEYKYAGENIAKGQKTAKKVVDAWMGSEGHKRNILSKSFTHIGVGHVKGGSTYWTQMFISK